MGEDPKYTNTAFEQAIDQGYIGSVPAETPATQPLTATGEPAVVKGQPETTDTPSSPDLPNTPHSETAKAADTGKTSK